MDAFTRAYITCALWLADPDPGSGEWGEHAEFTRDNIDPDTLTRMVNDCQTFQDAHAVDLATVGLSAERAGANFYLDRNQHGSGFMDDSTDVADVYERLSVAAKRYGTFELYLGDNGRVYGA